MTTFYEIPLHSDAQVITTTFPNGNTYQLRLNYQFNNDDCWLLDISDSSGNPIVQGIPLLSGVDLLGQYAYLGFGVQMFCGTDGDFSGSVSPKWWNLGSTAHLWIAA